ncbi:cupin domain-containing protein [Rhizobium sp. NZLR1]|uniref:cupin domain-containing protein n=1 Tax=Rhizobium sp. NZLR1 TaxID=2731096 RepID=UPI001A989070|nr:cupin domain-containing protein [Rhizobium sp. NZLR1]MBX5204060.1 cupin domain-containing protein [Rhizobium sp. NZLR1]QSZ25143.1 cupin domain-containing protein [Rhizobium sp. NZLR1]
MRLDIVRDGLSRTGIRAENALITINWLEAGYKSIGQHSHPFDQVSLVLSGRMRFFLGSEIKDVAAPAAVYIPGGLPHGGEPLGSERVLNIDVFAPLRKDYLPHCINRDDFEASGDAEAT